MHAPGWPTGAPPLTTPELLLVHVVLFAPVHQPRACSCAAPVRDAAYDALSVGGYAREASDAYILGGTRTREERWHTGATC